MSCFYKLKAIASFKSCQCTPCVLYRSDLFQWAYQKIDLFIILFVRQLILKYLFKRFDTHDPPFWCVQTRHKYFTILLKNKKKIKHSVLAHCYLHTEIIISEDD